MGFRVGICVTSAAIGEDNVLSKTDDAYVSGYEPVTERPDVWCKGKYVWVIPNRYIVQTEKDDDGDGTFIMNTRQEFWLWPNGKVKITKLGQTVERTPS